MNWGGRKGEYDEGENGEELRGEHRCPNTPLNPKKIEFPNWGGREEEDGEGKNCCGEVRDEQEECVKSDVVALSHDSRGMK